MSGAKGMKTNSCSYCEAWYDPAIGHTCAGNSVLPPLKMDKAAAVEALVSGFDTPPLTPAPAPAADNGVYIGLTRETDGVLIVEAPGGGTATIGEMLEAALNKHTKDMIPPAEHADTIRSLKGNSSIRERDKPRHVAVLRINKRVMAELLRLPKGTVIHRAQEDIYEPDTVDLMVEHPGLPLTPAGDVLRRVNMTLETDPPPGEWVL
jgi:hypothetical protein